ncbi:hypothetical protein SCLCIDRAFT_886083 [Scleroderma citrinum Foug A]|uniref:Uncharacterized protein n=1 Tax=Scleroderma citrinum Foug A TaxID=1036808 RepID=A0A0C3E790_9AGAM|nr:hypothetical protein SCLCIDRAFT_886083 [Scleroderma citrinum Foug A]
MPHNPCTPMSPTKITTTRVAPRRRTLAFIPLYACAHSNLVSHFHNKTQTAQTAG